MLGAEVGQLPEINLREYEVAFWPRSDLKRGEIREIEEYFKVDVALVPSVHQDELRFVPGSRIGILVTSAGRTVRVHPKIAVYNVIRLWELANVGVASMEMSNLVGVDSTEELISLLARKFLELVRKRLTRGLYKKYLPVQEKRLSLRGRLNTKELVRHPEGVRLPCSYTELTGNNIHNQVLLLACSRLAISAIEIDPAVRADARRLTHTMKSVVEHTELNPQQIKSLSYTRLNEDYRIIHALASFFIQYAAPQILSEGSEAFPAFVIDMNVIFQDALASCLARSLASEFRIVTQKRVYVDSEKEILLIPDILIYGRTSNQSHPLAIIDAKYKRNNSPSSQDISQVHMYSTELGCTLAWLVYPEEARSFSDIVTKDGVRIRSAVFQVSINLDRACAELAQTIREGIMG